MTFGMCSLGILEDQCSNEQFNELKAIDCCDDGTKLMQPSEFQKLQPVNLVDTRNCIFWNLEQNTLNTRPSTQFTTILTM